MAANVYWIAAADAAGNRLVGSEELLFPGPAEVDYPVEAAGSFVTTPNGRVVKQQPSYDPRVRSWIWHTMPVYITRFRRFVMRLESLVSRTRREQGLCPWIYIKDTETAGLRVFDFQNGTATSATSTTLGDTTKNWAVDRYKDGTVEIVSGSGAGQRRTIIANTNKQLTIAEPFTSVPIAAQYVVQASVSDWVRVRVLQVSKHASGKGGVWYDPVRLSFVVEDNSWNDLG